MGTKVVRFIRLARLFAVAGAALIALHADPVLTVGGTPYAADDIQAPFGDGIAPGEFQQVYDSSLFSVGGQITISSLTFQDSLNVNMLGDQINPAEYTISLSTTGESASSFFQTAASSLIVPLSATTVFSNSSDGCPFDGVSSDNTCTLLNPGAGFTITFSHTFSYDPLTDGNLLLDIVKTSNSSIGLSLGLDASDFSGCAGSQLVFCAPQNTPLMSSAYSTPDGTFVDPEGLVTGFGYTVSTTSAVPEPITLPIVIVWVGLGAAYFLRRRQSRQTASPSRRVRTV